MYALKRTALDNLEKFPMDVVDTLKRDFYVDDWLKSVKTTEKAIRMYKARTGNKALISRWAPFNEVDMQLA